MVIHMPYVKEDPHIWVRAKDMVMKDHWNDSGDTDDSGVDHQYYDPFGQKMDRKAVASDKKLKQWKKMIEDLDETSDEDNDVRAKHNPRIKVDTYSTMTLYTRT